MATSLTTSKLIAQVTEKAGKNKLDVSRKQVTGVVTTFLETISEEIRKGGKVNLKNFGVFRRHTKPARPKREGRNPATGETITIPARKYAAFQAAKGLKDRVVQ